MFHRKLQIYYLRLSVFYMRDNIIYILHVTLSNEHDELFWWF